MTHKSPWNLLATANNFQVSGTLIGVQSGSLITTLEPRSKASAYKAKYGYKLFIKISGLFFVVSSILALRHFPA